MLCDVDTDWLSYGWALCAARQRPLVADEMLPSAVTCAVRLGETLPLGLCPCYVPHRPTLSFSAVSLQAAVSVWAGRVGGGRGRLDSPARGVPLGTGRGLPYPGRAPLWHGGPELRGKTHRLGRRGGVCSMLHLYFYNIQSQRFYWLTVCVKKSVNAFDSKLRLTHG